MIECHLLDTTQLLPTAWAHMRGQAVSAFNPSLLPTLEGWLLAYRVVGPDGYRRLAMCRLDHRLRVVADSPTPFSDAIVMPASRAEAPLRRWFADPRIYRLDGLHVLHYNTGWQRPRNQQLLQAFDPATLLPTGPSRLLVLDGPRQDIEKNWLFFEDMPGMALYGTQPHRLLRVDLAGEGPICCRDAVTVHTDFGTLVDRYGALRGGAPPVRVGRAYWSIGHVLLPEGTSGRPRYSAVAYAFDTEPPFAPLRVPWGLLPLPNPLGKRTLHPPLNRAVGEVIYPCGAAFREGHFVISYGINDEHCAIARVPYNTVAATTVPLP